MAKNGLAPLPQLSQPINSPSIRFLKFIVFTLVAGDKSRVSLVTNQLVKDGHPGWKGGRGDERRREKKQRDPGSGTDNFTQNGV